MPDLLFNLTHQYIIIYITLYRTVIQKHIAEIAESGVIIYFSFLLLETKFINVLSERYIAITIQIIFVVLSENHSGINSPTCKIIITKNICKISCVIKTILSFLGKTLYCPPIVNSPNGNPQIIRNDNIITIEKTLAPIIAPIVNLLKVLFVILPLSYHNPLQLANKVQIFNTKNPIPFLQNRILSIHTIIHPQCNFSVHHSLL